jgi:hypothetical protein
MRELLDSPVLAVRNLAPVQHHSRELERHIQAQALRSQGQLAEGGQLLHLHSDQHCLRSRMRRPHICPSSCDPP